MPLKITNPLSSFKDSQPLNAQSPILFTLLGMMISFRDLQPKNALFPIVFTLPGMMISFNDEQL